MANEMYVEMGSLNQLKGELEDALSKFEQSFNDLENGIDALTKDGFIGEGAQEFKMSYMDKSKGTLESVKTDTRNIISYMDEKIASFRKTLDIIGDIATGR